MALFLAQIRVRKIHIRSNQLTVGRVERYFSYWLKIQKSFFSCHNPLLFKVIECLKSIASTISINFNFQGFGKKTYSECFLVFNHGYTLGEDLDFCLGRMAL